MLLLLVITTYEGTYVEIPSTYATPLTVEELEALYAAPAHREIGFGLDLLDANENLLEDFTDRFLGGEVEFNADARINGTARLNLAEELDWPNVRLLPYMLYSAGGLTTRTNLGILCPVEPEQNLGNIPVVLTAGAFDKLSYLARPIGDTWQTLSTTDALTAVEALLTASGLTGYRTLFDTSGSLVLSDDFVWVLDDTKTTYLQAIQTLLAAVAYTPMWVDNEGYFRARPLVTQTTQPSQWTFDLQDMGTNLLGKDRTLLRTDLDRTNYWRFIQKDADNPTEGAGYYSVDNSAGGVKYKQPVYLEADSQTELVKKGDEIVEQGGIRKTTLSVSCAPLPLLATWGYLPLVDYVDLEAGGAKKCQVVSYRIPLDGSDCTMVLEVVS